MKSLADDQARTELLERLEKLDENSQRRWGKMNVNQMLCHLADAFIVLQQDNMPAKPPNIFKKSQQKLLTTIAIYSGIPAPRGIQTAPAVDQEKFGTAPTEFYEDKQRMIAAMHQYSAKDRSYENCYHPIFGELSPKHWQCFGYLHVDHHFRQFGV